MSEPHAPEPDGEPKAGHRGRTLAWTSSTYFGEGLPWSILHQIAAEYLTAIGMRPAQVGYTAWLHGTTMLKFLWSPIVDLFGSLRQWMIAMQALMGIGVGVLALLAHRLANVAGHKDVTWLWLLLVGIGVLSATYDIACDGYYMGALEKRDQARFSGVRVAAFRAAMLMGSSALVFLGGYYNWLLAFGIAAGILIALALVHQRFLPHVARAARQPSPESASDDRWLHIKRAYVSFLYQPQALLVIAFLLTYKMADVLMFSMSKVLLAFGLGVPTDVRGALNSVSLGASILGAMYGGAWIARRGLKGTLFTITLLMAVTEPLFALLAAFAPELAVAVPGTVANASELDWSRAALGLSTVAVVIMIEQFCGGMATAAQMVFIMRRTQPEHRAAHYAFATAIYSASQMLVGGYSGRVYEVVGPVYYFWLASLLTVPAVILSRLVPTDREPEGAH